MALNPDSATAHSDMHIEAHLAALDFARRVASDDASFVRAFLMALNTAADLNADVDEVHLSELLADLPSPSALLLEHPVYVRNARRLYETVEATIMDGVPALESDFPECVAISCRNGHRCTGVLVARNAVLTAAHCACGSGLPQVLFGTTVQRPRLRVETTRMISHPEFDSGTKEHDIALLLLADDIPDVPPAQLAASSTINNAIDVRVVGYGDTDAGGTTGYGRRRYVDVPVASAQCASEDDQQNFRCHARRELVTGVPVRPGGPCTGDSGGPCYVRSRNGWELAALMSRSIPGYHTPCGDGSVNVRVDRYRAWLRSISDVHW